MQLYVKNTKRTSTFQAKALRSSEAEVLLVFPGSCIPTNRSFVIIGTTYTGTDRSRLVLSIPLFHYITHWTNMQIFINAKTLFLL